MAIQTKKRAITTDDETSKTSESENEIQKPTCNYRLSPQMLPKRTKRRSSRLYFNGTTTEYNRYSSLISEKLRWTTVMTAEGLLPITMAVSLCLCDWEGGTEQLSLCHRRWQRERLAANQSYSSQDHRRDNRKKERKKTIHGIHF